MSNLERITEISGIGESKIESFKEAGYETLEDLQGIAWEELGEIEGIKSSAKRRAILNLLEDEGLREKPEKEENYEKFKSLLKDLFQFESADLDFGIYKIMNAKRDEIEEFLNESLQDKVVKELDEFSSVTAKEAEEELEKAKEAIREDFPNWTNEKGEIIEEEFPEDPQGVMKERIQDYREAKEKVEKAEIGEETEAAIYQDLYRFFKRYYKKGDFIPQRRASNRNKYSIPYNGEEVKLHWANKNQYYVKTGENFKDYKFTKDSYEIEFKLHDAHVEKNNKKGDDKYFVLRDEEPVEQDDRFLTVHFEYRPLTDEDLDEYDLSESSRTKAKDIQRQIEEKILSEVSEQLEETLNKDTESRHSDSIVLQKHLKNYRTKNENDYFIHKNLGKFLKAELEEYLKNDVFSWKELTDDDNGNIPARVRARLNAIENIAKEIIEFLATIEDFQKKLFEKKKFVVNTEYCVTLDKIPEELYPKILENEDQIEEWKELYALEEQQNQGLKQYNNNNEIDKEFLKQNQSIMIDTKHFKEQFKSKLLFKVQNMESFLDGTMIKGENFQVINLLKNRYREDINYIYIDPPYNTGHSKIHYKNNYEDSSWISLMFDRVKASKELIHENSAYTIAIDDFEMPHLCEITDDIFEPEFERNMIIVNHHPQGSGGENVSRTHEYALFFTPRGSSILAGKEKDKDKEKRPFQRSGTGENNFRSGRPNSFYALLVDPEKYEVVGVEEPPEPGEDYPEGNTEDGLIRVYPKSQDGSERVWRRSYESAEKLVEQNKIICNESETAYIIIDHSNSRKPLYSNWTGKRYNAGTHGTSLIYNMFTSRDVFSYPKSLYTVLDSIEAVTHSKKDSTIMDFFAGSGTTAHATIKLNEQDEGDRDYIMVEMEDYFTSTLLPRVKKAVYSDDWDNGVPNKISKRSHAFKYLKIENYEDTLNNLYSKDEQKKMEEFNPNTLKYFLNFEVDGPSLLDLNGLKNPFSYEMDIREENEVKREAIDLVETFNYLLGLEIESIKRFEKFDREYRIVKGVKDEDEVVIVWRPVNEDDAKNFYSDEREFIESEIDGPDRLYVNHDSALERAKSIEKKFETEMWG